jgi:hypothetical protein
MDADGRETPRETKMRWLIAVLLLFAGSGTASADIRVDQSRYLDGKLLVTGSTMPGRTVTLDGKYETEADREGHFRFNVNYRPSTCMTEIRAGKDFYSAVVAGCLDPSFSGEPSLSTPRISTTPP